MTKNEYLSAISKQRKIQVVINDIFIWSLMAIVSLEELENQPDFLEQISSFPVPSSVPNKKVNRKTDRLVATLRKARTSELYKALIVYIVSLVEPVLMEIVRLTLQYDNRRVKTKPKGCDAKLDYDTIVDCGTYTDIIDVIISKHIDALCYSKPDDQLEYIQKMLSIEIDKDLWGEWVEIKASRDLIVHNNCLINKVYIDKVGDNKRGEIGEEIAIDEKYFRSVIVTSKSLIGTIVSSITKKENE